MLLDYKFKHGFYIKAYGFLQDDFDGDKISLLQLKIVRFKDKINTQCNMFFNANKMPQLRAKDGSDAVIGRFRYDDTSSTRYNVIRRAIVQVACEALDIELPVDHSKLLEKFGDL